MEQNQNAFAPESATDEPDSSSHPVAGDAAGPAEDATPRFASEEAEAAYWRGVTDGIRDAGREPGHPHLPADFELGLTRDGAAPGLTSTKLLEVWPHNPHDANPPLSADPRTRHDGWNPAKERVFLAALAETGVVADACRACKMSRDAAYARRRAASGRGFAIGWEAAILIARGAVTDDVMSRSRHGVIDRVYRNGELVAERHRYDNRLTMAVLTRLDRLAEGMGEGAPVARAVAQEFDRFLDLLPEGVTGAERFLSARFPTMSDGAPMEVREPPSIDFGKPESGSEQALLARLAAYEEHGVGLPAELDCEDLDPAEMAEWTEAQWEQAEFAGFLRRICRSEWPAAARDGGADGTDGMCKLRKLYLLHHPEPAEPKDDFEGRSVWEEDDGGWVTDFPPPDGFVGWQDGEPGDESYKRELTEAEAKAAGVDAESLAAEDAEALAEQLAAERAARDRYFGFDADNPPPDSRGRGTARSAVEGALMPEEAPPPASGRSPSPTTAGEDIEDG